MLTKNNLVTVSSVWYWVFMIITSHIVRVLINRVRLPILLVVSWRTEKTNIFLSPFAPKNLVLRNGSAVPSLFSLITLILRLNLVLSYGTPPEFHASVHFYVFKPPCAIGPVLSLSGHAIAYWWRSLPRVHWHGALFHTHYWYEVGMLKVPRVHYY